MFLVWNPGWEPHALSYGVRKKATKIRSIHNTKIVYLICLYTLAIYSSLSDYYSTKKNTPKRGRRHGKTTRFGIEIEMTGITRKDAALAAQTVLGGELLYGGSYYDTYELKTFDGRTWKFTYDGSIRCEPSGAGSRRVHHACTALSWSARSSPTKRTSRTCRRSSGRCAKPEPSPTAPAASTSTSMGRTTHHARSATS